MVQFIFGPIARDNNLIILASHSVSCLIASYFLKVHGYMVAIVHTGLHSGYHILSRHSDCVYYGVCIYTSVMKII